MTSSTLQHSHSPNRAKPAIISDISLERVIAGASRYPQVPLGWRKVTLEWDDGSQLHDYRAGQAE